MRRVVLRHSPTGLGLNIEKTGQGPFVITAVVEGKAAALGGEIKVNDLLHAVDTTSLYDLDAAQTKALVAGTSSQLGTNVALWIQAAPNGSGTPIQAQVLAKLKNDKDALHAELANLKAEFKALQLLFVTSQAELDRLKGKDTGEAVLTETDEDEIQRLQQEAAEHLRAVKEHRKELRRLQHAARNPELNKPVSASDAASAATLSRKTQDLVQGLQHLHDDLAQGLQHLHDDALDEALVSELAIDAKNLWLLRRLIAADPQAFFAQADTNQDGSLDRDEWAQACESVLGHAAPDLAKALFDKGDALGAQLILSLKNEMPINEMAIAQLCKLGGVQAMLEALALCPDDAQVQCCGIGTLLAIGRWNQELLKQIKAAGGEAVIKAAMQVPNARAETKQWGQQLADMLEKQAGAEAAAEAAAAELLEEEEKEQAAVRRKKEAKTEKQRRRKAAQEVERKQREQEKEEARAAEGKRKEEDARAAEVKKKAAQEAKRRHANDKTQDACPPDSHSRQPPWLQGAQEAVWAARADNMGDQSKKGRKKSARKTRDSSRNGGEGSEEKGEGRGEAVSPTRSEGAGLDAAEYAGDELRASTQAEQTFLSRFNLSPFSAAGSDVESWPVTAAAFIPMSPGQPPADSGAFGQVLVPCVDLLCA